MPKCIVYAGLMYHLRGGNIYFVSTVKVVKVSFATFLHFLHHLVQKNSFDSCKLFRSTWNRFLSLRTVVLLQNRDIILVF